MKVLPPVEEKLRQVVRDARAANPLIRVNALQEVLEKRFNRGFSARYIAKLADKVMRESLLEADNTQLRERLNVTREKFRIASEALRQIFQWEPGEPKEGETLAEYLRRVKPPAAEDVIEAAKNFAMLDAALLKVELECGLYKDAQLAEKQAAALALPDDKRNSVLSAFQKWGYLPPGTTVQMTERQLTVHAGNTQQN